MTTTNAVMSPSAMPVIANANRSKRDCTVVALTLLLDIPYAEAEQIMTKYGRTRKGWNRATRRSPSGALRFKEALAGILGGSIVARRGSVGKFVRTHPRGKYLVWVRGHVFAVMHGIVCDVVDMPNRRIKWAWSCEPKIVVDGN